MMIKGVLFDMEDEKDKKIEEESTQDEFDFDDIFLEMIKFGLIPRGL